MSTNLASQAMQGMYAFPNPFSGMTRVNLSLKAETDTESSCFCPDRRLSGEISILHVSAMEMV